MLFTDSWTKKGKTMSDRKRFCCNCGNNICTPDEKYPNMIHCHCSVDGHRIGYIECMVGWCKRWKKDAKGMVMGVELENRMISAEWLKSKCYEICDEYNTERLYIDRIIDEIDNAPDVEVVRCRDCRHFVQGEPYDPCECMKWKVKFGVAYTEPNGYCHKAERKDNG